VGGVRRGPQIYGEALCEIVRGFIVSTVVAVVVSLTTQADTEVEREFDAAVELAHAKQAAAQ